MKPDSQAIIHKLEPRTVKVWICGDVHAGAQGAQLDAWQKWLETIEHDPDSYVIFIGDLMDTVTRHSIGDIWTGMTPADQMDYIERSLRPLAEGGKILGVLVGNHELRIRHDTSIDVMYDVCVRLGIQDLYRRNYMAIRVVLGEKNNSKTYNMICFHGTSDLKARNMMNNIEGFDAIITGHTHQPITRIPAHLCLTQQGRVILKEVIQVTACSWCDYTGYGARGMYLPQVQSRPQCLELEWNSSHQKDKHISISW